MKFLPLVAAICFAATPAFAQSPTSPPAPPNIIFMLIDDMGWQETSVPFHSETTALNRRYHTPHMEQLAAEGMKFTQAYACAVCSPTRVSALTGMNAARGMVSPTGRCARIARPITPIPSSNRQRGT